MKFSTEGKVCFSNVVLIVTDIWEGWVGIFMSEKSETVLCSNSAAFDPGLHLHQIFYFQGNTLKLLFGSSLQSRIQNPVKHLRWSLRNCKMKPMKLLKIHTEKEFFSENSNQIKLCFIEKQVKLSLECVWMNGNDQIAWLTHFQWNRIMKCDVI